MALLNVKQIDQDSFKKQFDLDNRISKTIMFYFPLVQDGQLGGFCKFDWDGNINIVDAFCGYAGVEDTIIDIQKISEKEFKLNSNTWESIFTTDKEIKIPASGMTQDGGYLLSSIAVKKGDLFRIVFKKTGPTGHPIDDLKIRELTVQLHIEI